METNESLDQREKIHADNTAEDPQFVHTNVQDISQPGKQNPTDGNTMTVTISMRLMHYLFKEEKEQKNSKKLTKAQAFYDLLSKQQLAELTEDPDWINRGVMQLAKAWGWVRPSVNAFIDRLIEEKAARSFSYSGKNVVMLCGIKGLPENIRKLLKSENGSRQYDSSRQDARNHPGHTLPPSGSNL